MLKGLGGHIYGTRNFFENMVQFGVFYYMF